MFSRKEDLLRKTGEDGIGRLDYLEMLVKEFKETKSKEAKKQVLANLANFSYDPINYDFIRRLRIIDLFLEQLAEQNNIFVSFAIAGVCNLCLDPINKQYILRLQGIRYIVPLLASEHEEIVLNTLTTLIYMLGPDTYSEIVDGSVLKHVQRLKQSENSRIKNLAVILLTDLGIDENHTKP